MINAHSTITLPASSPTHPIEEPKNSIPSIESKPLHWIPKPPKEVIINSSLDEYSIEIKSSREFLGEQLLQDDHSLIQSYPVLDQQILIDIAKIKKVEKKLKKTVLEEIKKIQTYFEQGRYSETLKICTKILTTLGERLKSESKAAGYINLISFLCKLNKGDYSVLSCLPAKTEDAFIAWQHEIAEAAKNGTSVIKPSRVLRLCCLRRAADTTCHISKRLLIKEILFGDTESPSSFLPEEAQRLLKAMAVEGIVNPAPKKNDEGMDSLEPEEDDYDRAIHKLVRAVAISSPEERDSLADDFTKDSNPLISQLAPMLYLSDLFGKKDLIKAEQRIKHLKEISTFTQLPSDHQSHNILIYWQGLIYLKKNDFKKAETLFYKLSNKTLAARCQALGEFYIDKKKEYKIQGHLNYGGILKKEWLQECPDAAMTLHKCHQRSRKDKKTNSMTPLAQKLAEQTRANHEKLFEIARQHCQPEALTEWLQERSSECIGIGKTKCAGTKSVETLPKEAMELLEDLRFSTNPQVNVFQHFSCTLIDGKADETLILNAMKRDAHATLYRLMVLEHSSETMDTRSVRDKLVKCFSTNPDAVTNWIMDHDIAKLPMRLTYHETEYNDNPEDVHDLVIRIYELLEDKPRIADALTKKGDLLLKLDEVEKAKGYYSQAEKYSERDRLNWHLACLPKNTSNDRMIFVPDLPEHYKEIRRCILVCHSFQEANLQFKRLMHVFQQLQTENSDPSIHAACADTINSLLMYSSDFITPDQFIELSHKATECSQKATQLSHALLHNTVSLLQQKVRTVAKQDIESDDMKQLHKALDSCSTTVSALRYHDYQSAQETVPSYTSAVRWKSYDFVRQHYIEKQMALCSNPDKALELLQECLSFKERCDPVIIAQRFIPFIEKCSIKQSQELFKALTTLTNKICETAKTVSSLQEELDIATTCQIQCYVEKNKNKHDTRGICEELEVQKIKLLKEHPEKFSDTWIKTGMHKTEKKLFEQIKASTNDLESQIEFLVKYDDDESFMAQQLKYFKKHHPEAAALFHKLSGTVRFKHLSPRLKVCAMYLEDKDDSQKTLFKDIKDKKTYDSSRTSAIWLALESGLFSPVEAQRASINLAKDTLHRKFITILTAHNFEEIQDILPSLYCCGSTTGCRDYVAAISLKLLSFNKPELAYKMLSSAELPRAILYKAMMEWRHLNNQNLELIQKDLLWSASETCREAQCRTMDWVLEHSVTDPLVTKPCFRYLSSPDLMVTPEKKLYHGITLYTGTGCEKNEKLGFDTITEALGSDSPVPAFRLALLVQRDTLPERAFPLKVSLLKFAEKSDSLSALDCKELVLSCHLKDLKSLAEAARTYYEQTDTKETDDREALLKIATKLESWCEKWKPKAFPALSKESAADLEITVPAVLSRKEIEKETKCVLSQLTTDSPTDMDGIMIALEKLQDLQGMNFPDIDETVKEVLINTIPMNSEQGYKLQVKLINSLENPDNKQKIFERNLTHIATISSKEDIQWPREILLATIPEGVLLNNSEHASLCTLIKTFSDITKIPQRLLQLSAQLNSRELGELFEEKEILKIFPTNHSELFLAYIEKVAPIGVELIEHIFNFAPKDNGKLIQKAFEYIMYYPHSLNKVNPKRFYELFMDLPLPIRRQLISHPTFDSVVFNNLIYKARELKVKETLDVNTDHIRGNIRKMEVGHSTYSFEELYKLYIAVEEKLPLQLHRIKPNLLSAAQGVMHSTNTKNWDGSYHWLLARALLKQNPD